MAIVITIIVCSLMLFVALADISVALYNLGIRIENALREIIKRMK